MTTYNLNRFVEAQHGVFDTALAEIRAGHKRSHWMWFIFPQLHGLGSSAMAQHYGIASRDEAEAYLDHRLLGARYRACVDAVDALDIDDPIAVFGPIDAMKLRSSLTLFEAVATSSTIDRVLERFFDGERDGSTQRLLKRSDKTSD